MALTNWRTINIDLLDPDSSANFDISTLHPAIVPVSSAEAQQTTNQIRQLLRGGDSEGALRGALDTAPYGADDRGKARFLYLGIGTKFVLWHSCQPRDPLYATIHGLTSCTGTTFGCCY
jgi:hypothetical protein